MTYSMSAWVMISAARTVFTEGALFRDVASRMIDFAFEHIRYEDAEPSEGS